MKNLGKKFLLASLTVISILAAWYVIRAEDIFNVIPVFAQNSSEKPVDGWIICQDLGVGTVPGLDEVRQRFKLCHPTGWEVLTYCLRPGLPQPAIGASCTRTGEDTYWCGRGIQPVKEYTVVQIPTTPPPPTATFTPATPPSVNQPTHTPEEKPTQPVPLQPTRRPPPGGPDFQDWLGVNFGIHNGSHPAIGMPDINPTPTPFQPIAQTQIPTFTQSSSSASSADAALAQTLRYFSQNLHFDQGSQKIVVKVFPNSNRINDGNPIQIKFFPSNICEFGDKRGCVYELLYDENTEVKWISIHSGIGGEAQAFRDAVEGTSIDQTGYALNKIKQNIATLTGAPVEIYQGETVITDLELIALVRIPSSEVRDYLALPIEQALTAAAQLDPSFQAALDSSSELLVIETCGWRISGEPTTRGLSNTSSSIYVSIIRQTSAESTH